jgi:hypothetical protein
MIRGNRQFPTEELRVVLREPPGAGSSRASGSAGSGGSEGQVAADRPVFNQARFDQATEDVSQLYRNRGYLYAQVVPFVERTETETGSPAVAVGWEIVEREPAYVNRVAIGGTRGPTRT